MVACLGIRATGQISATLATVPEAGGCEALGRHALMNKSVQLAHVLAHLLPVNSIKEDHACDIIYHHHRTKPQIHFIFRQCHRTPIYLSISSDEFTIYAAYLQE